MHGVLVGPVGLTQQERARIAAPTLILAHRYDLLHPSDDAANLARVLPDAELVKARSPFELRLCPKRPTDRVALFLRDAWGQEHEHDDSVSPGTVIALPGLLALMTGIARQARCS